MTARDPGATPVKMTYFSDVLCIWAYCAEARVAEVKAQFGDNVAIDYRFCEIFADTATRVGQGWEARGGYDAFGAHVHEVAAKFGHVTVHPELWIKVRPASSASAHMFLKAIGLWQATKAPAPTPGVLEQAAWAVRLAFFRDGRDIATRTTQNAIADELELPVDAINVFIDNGGAMAALWHDHQAAEHFRIEGSPTFLLNDGRQKLYGNVGYRVIEANLRELLSAPDAAQASWC